jgi:hypothetical protein
MKRILMFTAVAGFASVLLLAGCAKEKETAQPAANAGPSAEGQKYLLAAEPAGAQEVIPVRNDAADGDEVTVVGRIGGDVNPWIEGRAAFSIVDNSLKACSDLPGDPCPTPWDYCCEADLAKGMLLVKVVNEEGQTVPTDAKTLLGVKELSTVIVQGKAERDDAGNLTLLAKKVYVK